MDNNSTERSLADVVPTPIVNTSIKPTPEGFDLAEFVAGVRPTRRAVQIFPLGHLIAQLEEIEAQIDAAGDDDDVDDLVDEFERIRDQFRDGVWFEIEKRSAEWVKKFDKDVEKRLGLVRKPKGGGMRPELSEDDLTTVTLHRLAAQIVTPDGMTYDLLTRMLEGNEGEVAKLMQCMTQANNELAESAEVLTRDFSARRSAKTITPAG